MSDNTFHRRCWDRIVALVLVASISFACASTSDPDATSPDAVAEVCSVAEDCTPRPCHEGFCINSACVYEARPGLSCEDGNLCSQDDRCNDDAECVAGSIRQCENEKYCLRSTCEPDTGECVLEPDNSNIPGPDACYSYACKDGVAIIATDKKPCDSLPIVPGGCTKEYVCDPSFALPESGLPCRPHYHPNLTPCASSNGDAIIPDSSPASNAMESVCGFNVCYASHEDQESVCMNSLELPKGVREPALANNTLKHLACSIDDFESPSLSPCNTIRCGCIDGDCSESQQAACIVEPKAVEGETCNSGNPCEIAECHFNDNQKHLSCDTVDQVICDPYPDSSCDKWLPCNPATGGCPLTMQQPESDANCNTGNTCIIEEETFCDPSDPKADPATGCVTSYYAPGTACSLGVNNACTQESQCLPKNDTELVCQSTGSLCSPSSQCRILVGCEYECDYLKLDGVYCDDGLACTDTSLCEEGHCVGVPTPGACDDGDPCTTDICSVAAQGCIHTSIPGCANSLCDLAGEAGETVTCKLHLVRQNAATAFAVGGRLIFEYADEVVEPKDFRLNACKGNGPCETVALSLKEPDGAAPPHAIATHPTQLWAWNGYGILYIIPGPGLDPVSTLIDKPGFLPDGQHTVEIDLELKTSLGPDDPAPFGLVSTHLAGPNGTLLVGQPKPGRIDLCESAGCPLAQCGDEPYPDGCGGTIQCPCETPCDYHGCAINAELQEAKRTPHSGDINDDGKVGFKDSGLYRKRVWQVLAGAPPSEEQAFPDTCIDLNCDGLIDPIDLIRSNQLAIAEFQANWGSLASDFDDDGVHDRCDNDDDGDGAPDICEWNLGSNPYDKTSVPQQACDLKGCDLPVNACLNVPDLNLLKKWSVELEVHCQDSCFLDVNYPACLESCLRDAGGLSPECSFCRTQRSLCAKTHCAELCVEENLECLECAAFHCDESYATCTGFETECDDGLDNNGDGFIDCVDPSCDLALACTSPVEPGPCANQIKTPAELDDAISASFSCSDTCSQQEVYPLCMDSCLELTAGLKGTCQDCFYVLASCSIEQCEEDCSGESQAACDACIETQCAPNFEECASLEFEGMGACENPGDMSVNFFEAAIVGQVCTSSCEWQPKNPACLSECLVDALGLSDPCVGCYTDFLSCSTVICEAECSGGFGPECGQCAMLFCGLGFEACAGIAMFENP